jgi:hypothetical protein
VVVAFVLALPLLLGSASKVDAQQISNEKQCLQAVKDTEEAITSNPKIGDKAEKILLEVMALAKQRCEEKQFANAKDLLELARGMVASE